MTGCGFLLPLPALFYSPSTLSLSLSIAISLSVCLSPPTSPSLSFHPFAVSRKNLFCCWQGIGNKGKTGVLAAEVASGELLAAVVTVGREHLVR